MSNSCVCEYVFNENRLRLAKERESARSIIERISLFKLEKDRLELLNKKTKKKSTLRTS